MTELYFLLVTLHVVLFAYWLGGDWGVYVCSKYIARPDLSMAERKRFLDALMMIDILPRTGIVLLPVIGLQMALLRGTVTLPSWVGSASLVVGAAWLAVIWTAYARRGTPFGARMTSIDIGWRAVLIVVLLAAGGWSLANGGPFQEPWVAMKLIVYAVLLVVGLYLRLAIRIWIEGFRRLATEGPSDAINALFIQGRERARWAAYVFWSLVVLTGYLGIRQPFF
ncbi:MAG: hypothetical protein IT483_07960 [Gammaproteobacteria bacterium]|nr:hypothetical protein [Gammaproteobacteria bacterium]